MDEKAILTKCFNMTQKCYNTITILSDIESKNSIDNIPLIHIYQAILILLIGKNYGYNREKINDKFEKIKKILNDIRKSPIKESKQEENKKNKYKVKKNLIIEKIKKMMEKDDNIKKFAIEIKEIEENDDSPLLYKKSSIEIIGNKIRNFFEKELKDDGNIPFYYKYFRIYQNCFKYIKELSNKENWENYSPEYITI